MNQKLKYCEVKFVDEDESHLSVSIRASEGVCEDLIHEFSDLDFEFSTNDSDDDSLQFTFTNKNELDSAVKIIQLVKKEISV